MPNNASVASGNLTFICFIAHVSYMLFPTEIVGNSQSEELEWRHAFNRATVNNN